MDSKAVAGQLFTLLEHYGVKRIVCSPGSRNAALLQIVDNFSSLQKYVVVDERSAAFIAMGMAMVSREPVALVCTSGSALLNYAPAVAEAYYQGIPLIVISADRPQIWIDQDDSQTIRQPGALSNVVKGHYDLDGDSSDKDYLWYANRQFNEGLELALTPKRGPVHFNIHLDGHVPVSVIGNDYGCPRKINVLRPRQALDNAVMKQLACFARDKKIMVTAGFMPPDNRLQKAMTILAGLPNVCIMAETLSNIHLDKDCFMVDSVLFPLSESEEKDFRPELIISIGGALVSRRLKEFLRRCGDTVSHWAVGYSHNIVDCFQFLSTRIEVSPAGFFQTFAKLLKREQKESGIGVPDYATLWKNIRKAATKDWDSLPWSDLKALHIVLGALPESTNLFLSNGTSVRYGQIIPYRVTHATYGNRGVSGIEGCTSTAVGASLVYDRITCLITGDTSFGYDIGGLGADLATPGLRIVVLDNGGGDIFRFINATCHLPIREDYLCADMNVPVEQLATAYDWDYFHASDSETLKRVLKRFFSPYGGPSILHIDTSQVDGNAEILRNFLNSK